MCDFLPDFLQDIWSGLIGAAIALVIDFWLMKRSQKAERIKVINAVASSLNDTWTKAKQMLFNELRGGMYPSYPLDTSWLGAVIADGRRNYPSSTIERINELRFEMEHLNKKMLIQQIRVGKPDTSVFAFAADMCEKWEVSDKATSLQEEYQRNTTDHACEDNSIAWLILGCIERSIRLKRELLVLRADESDVLV